MKVEISNIKIKVNKKSVILTLAESKLLFEKLNEIFGPRYNYYYPWTITNTTPLRYDNGTGSVTICESSNVPTFTANNDSVNLSTTTNLIDLTNKGK